MAVDAFNIHRRLEALSRAVFNLDTLSPQYWSMLFTVARSFFRLAAKMDMTGGDDLDEELNARIRAFLKIFKKFDHGKVIYPTLLEIEMFMHQMPGEEAVMLIRDRSFIFGTRSREISKAEISGLLNEIREWIYLAVQDIDVKYQTPNLNVEI